MPDSTELRVMKQIIESLCNEIYRGDDRDHLLMSADMTAEDVRRLWGIELRTVAVQSECVGA